MPSGNVRNRAPGRYRRPQLRIACCQQQCSMTAAGAADDIYIFHRHYKHLRRILLLIQCCLPLFLNHTHPGGCSAPGTPDKSHANHAGGNVSSNALHYCSSAQSSRCAMLLPAEAVRNRLLLPTTPAAWCYQQQNGKKTSKSFSCILQFFNMEWMCLLFSGLVLPRNLSGRKILFPAGDFLLP